MAFSFRKMLSNINYFKKPGEDVPSEGNDGIASADDDVSNNIDFDRIEPDSTSKQCATSLKLPDSVKKFTSKKSSLSDTDLHNIHAEASQKEKRKSKKLKIDIKKASQSMSEAMDQSSTSNIENTPKHILLDSQSADLFSQHFRGFDFNNSFDIFDAMSEDSSCVDENIDIESLSDKSEDITLDSDDGEEIKMCRKVEEACEQNQLVPSATPESFGDVEVDKNEEDRMSLLLNYQMRLEKLECVLKKMLTEFQFHVEVSKVFHCRSFVTTLPGTDVSNIPKMLGEVTYIDNLDRGISPTGSWNIVMEKEDEETKFKVKKQLLSMKHYIDEFVNAYLQNNSKPIKMCKKLLPRNRRSITFDLHKNKRHQKRLNTNNKKKFKHFDYPDIREAMINLFDQESMEEFSVSNTQSLINYEDVDSSKCVCRCQLHRSPSTQTDSGLTTKNDASLSSQSITSSIGNFSLDTSTLTAYSESLDQIVSYNSFQDSSLYSTLLQKAAIERITFYVQVHSIQLKCEQADEEFESKNVITFHCPACKSVESDESGLLHHILSQKHCEKIHFLYKTAYIKKCVASGKEIQPSTVLNPMKMYRDDNKIVCFGDAMYACSLCFENLIVGESVLMGHCSEPEHVERREKLLEMLE